MTSAAPNASPSPFRGDCLVGQVAVVTGGGSGIGFEIARQLSSHGCRAVVICGRRRTFLDRAARQLRSERENQQHYQRHQEVDYQVCDVRSYEQCKGVVEYVRRRFGRLDVLVNGAAGNFLAEASQLSSKGFATVMNIDAVGTFNMSRASYPLLSSFRSKALSGGDDDDDAVVRVRVVMRSLQNAQQ